MGGLARFPLLTHCAVALVSLLLVSLAFHPADIWWLGWVAFVPWMAWHESRPRRGTARALMLAYAVHFAYVLWWVGEVSLPLVFAIPFLGMPFVFALAWTVDRLVHRLRLPGLLVYPLAIVAMEVVRDAALGLTWSSVGYTQWRWLEGVQTAAVFRVHGLSATVLLVNAAFARTWLWWRGRGTEAQGVVPSRRSALGGLAAAAVLVLIVHLGGAWRLRHATFGAGPKAAGIQANLSQHRKMRGTGAENWDRHFEVYAHAGGPAINPDLLVFSETSLRGILYPSRPLERVLAQPLDRSGRLWGDLLPRGSGQVSVLGYAKRVLLEAEGDVPDDDGDGYQEWNVAGIVRLDPRAEPGGGQTWVPVILGEFAKRVCVPFGEYVPLPHGFPGREWLKQAILDAGGFIPDLTPGNAYVIAEVETERGTWQFGPNICYEMVFPGEFRALVQRGADFIVNISNDGWYGQSSELDLVHVAGRFRAVEVGRSVFRVSNSGISTSVDPCGRFRATVAQGGRNKQVSGVLVDQIQIAEGLTPFARWGDLPSWGFVLALIGLGIGTFLARGRA